MGLKHGQGARTQALLNVVESRDDVREETRQVVVVLVQRKPRYRNSGRRTRKPLAHQSGLTETNGGGDEGQRPVQSGIEPLGEAGASHDAGPNPWLAQLRGKEWGLTPRTLYWG